LAEGGQEVLGKYQRCASECKEKADQSIGKNYMKNKSYDIVFMRSLPGWSGAKSGRNWFPLGRDV
jgi:hypothetical protein